MFVNCGQQRQKLKKKQKKKRNIFQPIKHSRKCLNEQNSILALLFFEIFVIRSPTNKKSEQPHKQIEKNQS